MRQRIGLVPRNVSTANLAASAGATRVTLPKNLSPSLAARFFAPILVSRRSREPITPATLPTGLTVLKNDKRAIFTAAAHAERAAGFLHGLQPKTEAANTEEQEAA